MLKPIALPGLAGRLDRLGGLGLFLSRVIIGYLWFTQLSWKLPPSFGCPADFAVSTSLTARTAGLCDWTGLMAFASKVPLHKAFVAGFIQAVNLYIGLVALPFEWYWTYGMLYTLHIVFFFLPPGRIWGVDSLLIPRFQAAAGRGNRLAQIGLLFV